jgi:pimeloyl-ACP methyl ester carboxylesterase
MELKQGRVTANRLDFAYLDAGSGPLALCLHGFPDSPWTYRYLLPALAEAGYRAVAPFMRGYAPTEISADGHYRTSDFVADAVALHQALGGDGDAVLIAHDWGATAAWGAAALEPQRWRRVVIANVPPLQIFSQIAFQYDQLKRSFYFWFFQMSIAESIVGANDLAFIDGLWADWSPGYNATDDLARVKECLRDPANLRAAMGYYRAFFDPVRFGSPEGMAEQGAAWGRPTPQSTLYLHGTNDGCIALDVHAAADLRAFLSPDSQVDRIEGVGHFLLVERPQEVNDRIMRFLYNETSLSPSVRS